MIFYTLVTGLTALLGLGLGLFVYFHRPHTPLKISWVIFSYTIGFWSLGYFISLASGSYQTAITASRLSHASGAFIPITFFHFVLILLRRQAEKRKILIAGYMLGTILFLFCFTPFVVRDVIPKMGIRYYPDWGPLYTVYAATYLVFVGYACLLMILAMNITKGLEQRRIIYLFTASVLGFSGGISLFLLIFNIPFPPYGSALICLYPIIMSYSIVKHQLMEIEVIIKRTIVFTGIVAAAVSVISLPFALIQAVIGKALGFPDPFVLMALGIATAVLIYRPVERVLVNITDKFLFQKKYNYHKLLRENSKQISLIKSLDEMAKQIVAFLIKQGRIRNAGIFIQLPDQKRFELKYPLGYGGKTKRPSLLLEAAHPLVKLLVERKTSIVLEKIEKEARGNVNVSGVDLEEVLMVMRRLKAEVIIPSFLGTASNNQGKNNSEGYQLRNLLVLGPKKSDEEYTDEDLDVFFTIAQDSAIAAENARLFDLILKERESRLKAESEARLATYGKSTVHESKNAMAGLYDPAQFMTIYGYEDLKNIYERFLRGKLPSGAEKKFLELVETMKRKGELIFTKADELLIIAKTGEGTLSSDEKQFEKFNLKMVWDAAKAEAKTDQCKLIRYVPDQFYPHGNVILMKRVLINLMNNAAEAMKYAASGEIVLRARYGEIDEKKVALFEFSDNGPGIPSEDLSKIWEFGWSTKPKPQSSDIEASGRGQGLWRVKDTIENIHGGKIRAESELGKGTTFKFWIPLNSDQSDTDLEDEK